MGKKNSLGRQTGTKNIKQGNGKNGEVTRTETLMEREFIKVGEKKNWSRTVMEKLMVRAK